MDKSKLPPEFQHLLRRSWWDRFMGILTLRFVLYPLERWLDHKFKSGVYELQGDQIIRGRGASHEDRIHFEDIHQWQIVSEMGFDLVVIQLTNGQVINWIDKYDDLVGILRQVANQKEQPWQFA
jgi:hypothetical protein